MNVRHGEGLLALVIATALVCAGVWSEPADALGLFKKRAKKDETQAVVKQEDAASTAQIPKSSLAPKSQGTVQLDVANALGHPVPARVDLVDPATLQRHSVRAFSGQANGKVPVGRYKALVYSYESGMPLMVHAEEVVVSSSAPVMLYVNALGRLDRDQDWVLDRVEQKMGTDPTDPASFPGAHHVFFDSPVLSTEAGWYKGELHARSELGGQGTESVAELIRRAERAGLDFLAIADRNSMASTLDPAYQSKKLALIPAMEWGDDETGLALIYGPRTMPQPADNLADAQVVVELAQAQGGVFAVAHPCFPSTPWQWGLRYVNAVQVWCREYASVPPISLARLDKPYQPIGDDKKLYYSMSKAANTNEVIMTGDGPRQGISANGQAEVFWDEELKQGLRACAIGGSSSASKGVPLGQPVTYVYAPEKSTEGILAGLRAGFTFVSSGPKGPEIYIAADVGMDGRAETQVGGAIPVGQKVEFEIRVLNAQGKKLEFIRDGDLILARKIDSNRFGLRHIDMPDRFGTYRARVVEAAPLDTDSFGYLNVLALTSPIYAMELMVYDPNRDPNDYNITIKSNIKVKAGNVRRDENGNVVNVNINNQELQRALQDPSMPEPAPGSTLTPSRY